MLDVNNNRNDRVKLMSPYLKQNIVIMGFGLVALALSGAYLAYLKATISQSKTYIAIDEDGTQTLQEKRSKWV